MNEAYIYIYEVSDGSKTRTTENHYHEINPQFPESKVCLFHQTSFSWFHPIVPNSDMINFLSNYAVYCKSFKQIKYLCKK